MISSQKILVCLLFASLLLTGCAASYSKQDLRTVDDALRSGNGSHLTGKLGYLYRKEARKVRVEQAARNLDPSNLDRIELVMYKREVRRQARTADKLEYQRLRAEENERKEQKRLAEEKVRQEKERALAAEAAKEEQRLAAVVKKPKNWLDKRSWQKLKESSKKRLNHCIPNGEKTCRT